MSSCISLTGSNIFYEFPNGTPLFRNLHFSFGPKIYGLIGSNGAGKTTFLKMLIGDLQPTQGAVSVRGKIAVLPQVLNRSEMKNDLRTIEDVLNIRNLLYALKQIEKGNTTLEHLETVGENWNLEDKIQQIFHSLGISYLPVYRPVTQLSGGELVKVLLASIQLKNPEIILLDEPTNNLDENGRRALCDFLQSHNPMTNKCIIVVSHDRSLLNHVDSITELSNQGLQFYGGNFEFYLKEREKETQSLEQKIDTAIQEQKRQKFDLQRSMERQQKRMIQGKRKAAEGGIPKIIANGLKRKAQITTGKIKEIQEDRLHEALLEIKTLKSKVKLRNQIQIDLPETLVHPKKEILKIMDFNFKYTDSTEFLFSSSIHFHLIGPKRVRISGPNGAGKTTLVKLLLRSHLNSEILGETRGILELKSKRVEYLDQNVEILGDKNLTLLESFSNITPHLSLSERRIRLGRFIFHQDAQLKKIKSLSGGEKMRAALAFVLFSETPPELLILDEPTNNLDLDSIERIESALSHFQGAILAISHDSEFLDRIGASEELLIPYRPSLRDQSM